MSTGPLDTPLPNGFRVGQATSFTDIRMVWEKGRRVFEASGLGFKTLCARLGRYPAGGIFLWEGRDLVAGFGLWPVAADVYCDLRLGTAKIGEPSFYEIPNDLSSNPANFWIMSPVFVAEGRRRAWVVPALLSKGLAQWYRSGHVASLFRVLAARGDSANQAILEALQFSSVNHSSPTQPLRELQASVDAYDRSVQGSITRHFPVRCSATEHAHPILPARLPSPIRSLAHGSAGVVVPDFAQ